MEKQQTCPVRRSGLRSAQAGMTLIETVIALAILFIVATGLMGLGVVATITTENQGHLATRTAEYAQDKMEQLLSLEYSDPECPGAVPCNLGTDTISPDCVDYLVDADCSDGERALWPGGDLNFASADLSYVDYLDARGNALGGGVAPPAGWFYMRVWRIEAQGTEIPGSTALPIFLKRITVSCRARTTLQGTSAQPFASTLTSIKAKPF